MLKIATKPASLLYSTITWRY